MSKTLLPLDKIIPAKSIQRIDAQRMMLTAKAVVDYGTDRKVVLTSRDTPVKTQFGGTCTTFSTIGAMENKLGGKVDLSERSLWDWYGEYSTEEAISAATLHYVLEEKYWPQDEVNFNPTNKGKGRCKLSQNAYIEDNWKAVMAAIDRGNPCVAAMQTPKDLYAGHVQVEATSGMENGGHAIATVGYKVEHGKPYFLVKNSWGVNNGDKGYQWIAFELFERRGYAVFWEIIGVEDRLVTPSTPPTTQTFILKQGEIVKKEDVNYKLLFDVTAVKA